MDKVVLSSRLLRGLRGLRAATHICLLASLATITGCSSAAIPDRGVFGVTVSSVTPAECQDNGGLLLDSGTSQCITSTMCTGRTNGNQFINANGDTCVSACSTGEGVDSTDTCTTTPSVGDCVRAGQVFSTANRCTAACGATQGIRSNQCITDPMIPAECLANFGRLLDMGTQVCITTTQCTRRGTGNRYINAAAELCVSMCVATEGRTTSGRCTTTPTGDQCQENGARLLDSGTTTCITGTMCTARARDNQYISAGTHTCVAACEAAQGLIIGTKTCTTTPTATHCQANGGAFLRGRVCVAMCQASDGLRSGGTCVTSNPTAGECAANGALLSVSTTNCIASSACVAPNFINNANACVAACPATQGADGTRNCTATITPTNCGNAARFLKGGNCVDMCEGTEFINVDNNTCVATCGMLGANSSRMCQPGTPNVATCSNANTLFDGDTDTCVAVCTGTRALVNSAENECVSMCATAEGVRGGACVTDPIAAECQANGGRLLDGGTTTCITGAMCTARGSDNQYISAGTHTCVAACEAAQGLIIGTKTCTTAPTATHCQANGGAFLRGGGCVAMCQASDGLRATHTCVTDPTGAECQANGGRLLDGGTTTCITGAMCTARSDNNQYISADTHMCVTACDVTQGLDATTKTCIAMPTAEACRANGGQVYNADTRMCEMPTVCTGRGSGKPLY